MEEFIETEEIYNLALALILFYYSPDKENGAGKKELVDLLTNKLRPYNFTELDPYDIYIDGDMYCDIYFHDGMLVHGKIYSQNPESGEKHYHEV